MTGPRGFALARMLDVSCRLDPDVTSSSGAEGEPAVASEPMGDGIVACPSRYEEAGRSGAGGLRSDCSGGMALLAFAAIVEGIKQPPVRRMQVEEGRGAEVSSVWDGPAMPGPGLFEGGEQTTK